MRSPFGLLGLVLALLIVGLLAKSALRSNTPAPSAVGMPAANAMHDVRTQRDQAVQQVQKALDDAAETARKQRDAADQP
ncbi:hypothetical protein AAFF27_13485 [Xylophilus sp. GW821-FHT01B05]